jgi:tetratricopeptide (TPR) repeat protein
MKELLFIGLLFTTTLQAQISVFEGQAVANPQSYSDIGMKHIADADNLMQQGSFENAILSYDNAIAQNPMSAEAYVKRGIAKYRIGREAEAKNDLQKAVILNPYASDLHGFGGSLKRLNVLAFEPMELIAQPDYQYMLSYYQDLWNTDKIDLENFTITKENVNEIGEKVLVAQVIDWIQEGKTELAEDILLHKDELKAVHYDLLGIMKKMQFKWKLAYLYFEQAIEENPMSAASYYYMSIIQTHDKAYPEAMQLIEKALTFNPSMLKAHFHKAILYKMMEQSEDALSVYEELQEDTELIQYELHVNMAITNKILGNPTAALTHIQEAIRLDKADQPNEKLYILRGNIYMLIDEHQRAIEDYTQAITIKSDYAEAYFNRAMAQILGGNRADACHDLQRSSELGYFKAGEKAKYFCVF